MTDEPSQHQQSLAPLTSRSPEQSTAQSIRRILRELKEIQQNQNPLWTAAPLDLNEPYEWHFTMKGPPGTVFEDGAYHGRLVLPINYPMAPPSLYFLTPNGRFEVYKPVCLSASNYHPETWQPAWGIRSMLEALVAFMPTPAEGAVGALESPEHVRRQLAKQSQNYRCNSCQMTNAELIALHCADTVKPSQEQAHEDQKARLEEIRRQRTPAQGQAGTGQNNATGRFSPGTPIMFIFLYWLGYFLSQSIWNTIQRKVLPRNSSLINNPRQHALLLILVVVAGAALIKLILYASTVLSSTFFLLDVPFDQHPQAQTNPTMLKQLSVAERTEDFSLHPWIAHIVRAFQVA